jgi:hypothetical protein
MTTMRRLVLLITMSVPLWLGGCDMLGIESASAIAARKEAEGKAVGGACRHAGRAIEDCYALNKRADKAAVFAGWREMNDYMRENKIESVVPSAAGTASTSKQGAADEQGDKAAADEPKKAAGGHG